MLNKCANPVCGALFRNLRDGRVFVTEVESECQSSISDHGRQRPVFLALQFLVPDHECRHGCSGQPRWHRMARKR